MLFTAVSECLVELETYLRETYADAKIIWDRQVGINSECHPSLFTFVCLKCESASTRFQPGEGLREGLQLQL